MAQQKRVTDFFLLPRTSKSPAFLPRTPLFDLNNKAVMRKKRLTVQDNDITQTTLDAGQKIIGGQYCQVEFVNVNVGFSSDLSLWGIDIRRTIWLCVLNELVSDGEPILGVNRIWTHPQARRKGVATTVLDIIRRKFLLGEVLPKHRVAFSDPTDDGRRFAEHYMQDCKESITSIMVYTATK
uniref:Acetyltransf_13 domain-containing protein n=1 Tax=Heterorhabditis bacteriophora TaxID=37862 RepID=A0A1I7WX68_HETBA